jgi:hypothetical protein
MRSSRCRSRPQQAHPQAMQPTQDLQGKVRVGHERALGDLQHQPVRRDLPGRQLAGDLIWKMGSSRQRVETLTATDRRRPPRCQRAACSRAASSTQRVRGWMSPVRSASGVNSPGPTLKQKPRASLTVRKPTTAHLGHSVRATQGLADRRSTYTSCRVPQRLSSGRERQVHAPDPAPTDGLRRPKGLPSTCRSSPRRGFV